MLPDRVVAVIQLGKVGLCRDGGHDDSVDRNVIAQSRRSARVIKQIECLEVTDQCQPVQIAQSLSIHSFTTRQCWSVVT